MIGWLYRVIFGNFRACEHLWETEQKINIFSSPSSSRPYETVFVLRCEKCGNMKKFRS